MSLKTAHAVAASFFCPIGDTPAVCLTENLPPELDAKLLLLGCGDTRNILFTIYSGAQIGSRKFDFTCCDLQAEVIARNIFMLTLIMDDTNGRLVSHLWNIYYHVFIDSESLAIVQQHCKKLLTHAESLTAWQNSDYAQSVRFCDSTTLQNVKRLWEAYGTASKPVTPFKRLQVSLKFQWKTAKRSQAERIAGLGTKLPGTRSVAPLLQGVKDMNDRYLSYWKSGTCLDSEKMIQTMTIANPLFLCENTQMLLHYNTMPTAGYHIANLYAKFAPPHTAGDQNLVVAGSANIPNDMAEAVAALATWSKALRRSISKVIVRFVNCDAIAFCHVLQHQNLHRQTETAFWYRQPFSYEPLVLDSSDYGTDEKAPTTFNVIDTSNLIDSLGALSILPACSLLLHRAPTSVLRTQLLVPRESDMSSSIENLLCGHLPAVSLLLGLKPVQYWTNASPTWNFNSVLYEDLANVMDLRKIFSQPVILWRPVNLRHVRYEPVALAKFVFNVYLKMICFEDLIRQVDSLGLSDPKLLVEEQDQHELYTHATFAAILRCIMASNVVEWLDFLQQLVGETVLRGKGLDQALHHFPSFLTHLGLSSPGHMTDIFQKYRAEDLMRGHTGPFQAWIDPPFVLCITLLVPRKKFNRLNERRNQMPICEIQVQTQNRTDQHIYSDMHLGFGTVEALGQPFTNDYKVSIQEDPNGEMGSSSVIVCAMVSIFSLLKPGNHAARIVFRLKKTAKNAAIFASKLENSLEIHSSVIGQRDVFVSRYRPNMSGHVSVGAALIPRAMDDDPVKVTVTPQIGTDTLRFDTIQLKYDICDGAVANLLDSNDTIRVDATNPFSVVLCLGRRCLKKLDLPLPCEPGLISVARAQRSISYTAPVLKVQDVSELPSYVFPVVINEALVPVLEQLHYVNIERLPELLNDDNNERNAQWLEEHTSIEGTMSQSEMNQFDDKWVNGIAMSSRLIVKYGISAIYDHVFGFDKAKSTYFIITQGSLAIGIILVNCVRLNASHQSTLIDAAFFPLWRADQCTYVPDLSSQLPEQPLMIGVRNTTESQCWRQLMPAFAECCRSWQHKPTCEFKVNGKFPLSLDLLEPFICSCGLGHFPDDYLKHVACFKEFSKHAIRIAIPLIFTSTVSPEIDVTYAYITEPGSPASSSSEPCSAAQTQREHQGTPPSESQNDSKGSCFNCGARRAEQDVKMLLRCTGCLSVDYCSKECQAEDWEKGHRKLCKSMGKRSS